MVFTPNAAPNSCVLNSVAYISGLLEVPRTWNRFPDNGHDAQDVNFSIIRGGVLIVTLIYLNPRVFCFLAPAQAVALHFHFSMVEISFYFICQNIKEKKLYLNVIHF